MAMALDTLVSLVDAQVAALSASDFQLDPRSSGAEVESWHHSDAPFDATATAGGRQHLEYVVQVDGVSQASDQRTRRGHHVLMDADISVVFDYRVRPSSQVDDYRLAMRAAALIVSRIARPAEWAPGQGVMYQGCIQRFRADPTDTKLLFSVTTTHRLRYIEGF